MNRSHWGIAAIIAASVWAAPATAQDDEADCAAEISLTAALFEELDEFSWMGHVGEGAAPSFLLADLYYLREARALGEGADGAVILVRDEPGAWRAVSVHSPESATGVYVAEETGDIAMFLARQIEGPGPWWTLAISSDGFATARCVHIAHPEIQSTDGYAGATFLLADFNIDADGAGEIIAYADVERDGEERRLWRRYETSDNGATWSAPEAIDDFQPVEYGGFAHIDASASMEALRDELAGALSVD